MARAAATGWTDCDRGPQAYAEERIRSAHRAIEIRDKRRGGPLVASCLDYLALQPPLRVSGARAAMHATGQ